MAIGELISIKGLLEEAFLDGGEIAVIFELRRLQRSIVRGFGVHFWKNALYEGLCADRGFVSGGFAKIC
ncbi:hypothetical protein H351_29480 [Rhodococcus erythropolis R138]|nr:hypothetical protein H351_29480 [Rhodococcus erythropolis R138]